METEISAASWRSFGDGFERPNADDVKAIVDEAGWTQAYAAKLVGVDDRTFRRYCDQDDTNMPYAQWQQLLYHANYDIGPRAILADQDG